MTQIIKLIGETGIYLNESKEERWGTRDSFVVGVICALIISFAIKQSDLNTIFASIIFGLFVSFIVCVGVLVLGSMLGLLVIKYPVYIISAGRSKTFVWKTNDPAADQAAICKAAKELEEKAWEYENHRKELERIAANCK